MRLSSFRIFFNTILTRAPLSQTALPVLEKLDPYNFFITYRLFRDATRATDDGPVKDLSYLNRDLSKVIVLDTHANHVRTHPENAIVMSPWKGEVGGPEAKGLVEMIPFLECKHLHAFFHFQSPIDYENKSD